MLTNLLDVAMPTFPIVILYILDEPLVIFLLAVVGIILLVAVIAIFYTLSKKKKTADVTPKIESTENLNDEDGEK